MIIVTQPLEIIDHRNNRSLSIGIKEVMTKSVLIATRNIEISLVFSKRDSVSSAINLDTLRGIA